MQWIRSFLDNNSVFGRLMTRCGILIAANLLFLLGCAPVVTAGASLAALYTVLFKTLRGDGELNPFRVFWQGFRDNFKQATIAWLAMLALAAFLGLELFWCAQFTGPVALFRYGLTALLLIEAVLALYLFPVMAAFRGSLFRLVQDCVYFAVRRPVTLILVVTAHLVPVMITAADPRRLPLYAFLWCLTGFSAVGMFCADLLLGQFAPLLGAPPDSDVEAEPSQEEILDDMKKLGM